MKKAVVIIAIGGMGLTGCHFNDRTVHSSTASEHVVMEMNWLEETDAAVVEYLEETAAAEYVINTSENKAEVVYELHEVDRPPLFSIECVRSEAPWVCSEQELYRYIMQNVEWPYDAERNMEEGTEVVKVLIGPNGDLQKIIEINSQNRFCTGCRDAAVHVIESMPRWIPGIKNGQPVSVQVSIPVRLNIVS